MALICEDLSSYGVVLITPDSQQYFDLLADIERRLQNRPVGAPPIGYAAVSRVSEHDTSGSAILVNRGKVAIAAVGYVWFRRLPNGNVATSSRSPGTNPSVLLPFLQRPQSRKFDAYWHTIFPGSKRLITLDGDMYGDNTDVRPPASDELLTGGFGTGSGRGSNDGEPFKLTLDGVFFVDGKFAGKDQLGSWDQLVASREAYLSVSDLARRTPASEFFAQMDRLSGLDKDRERAMRSALAPLPPRRLPPGSDIESIREYQRQCAARTALRMRNAQGEAAAVVAIARWLDIPGPELHRL